MIFSETLRSSVDSLGGNKVRTALTMLGVIIGVFAVVTLVALGKGVQNYITEQFEALGSNLVFVSPGRVNFSDDPAKSFTNNKLEQKHIDLINEYSADYVLYSTPSYRVGKVVKFKNKNFYATITGQNEDAHKIFNYDLVSGRHLTRSDVAGNARVAVIGPLVAEELFPNIDAVGQEIILENDRYEVIGVTAKKNQDYDDNVHIPFTSLEKSLDISNFSGIAVKINEDKDIKLAMKSIERSLLRDLSEDDFTVLSPEDILASFQNILGILTAALGGIAGISLVVGGIGIMNIMLVSVTERTREIGLRKAIGASPKDIAMQFLVESVLISVSGGLIGLLFGFLATQVAQNWVQAEVTFGAVILAFGFSVAVGVLFGTYPAIKASKKDPIEALRFEF